MCFKPKLLQRIGLAEIWIRELLSRTLKNFIFCASISIKRVLSIGAQSTPRINRNNFLSFDRFLVDTIALNSMYCHHHVAAYAKNR